MKTQKEIEQLALQIFPIEMVAIFTQRDKVDKNKERRKIFIETYTQCQEDMADKKYTERDRIMKFLDNEQHLGISDKKTIERIKWYFENYFEQFKPNKQD